MTISGETKINHEESENYLLAECPSGKFHRVLTLPTPLDSSKVQAELENGILILIAPKAEEAKPRTIKVTRNNPGF